MLHLARPKTRQYGANQMYLLVDAMGSQKKNLREQPNENVKRFICLPCSCSSIRIADVEKTHLMTKRRLRYQNNQATNNNESSENESAEEV